jgi:hypothetical protein
MHMRFVPSRRAKSARERRRPTRPATLSLDVRLTDDPVQFYRIPTDERIATSGLKIGGSTMPSNSDDPYVQLEIALTDLLTERDRFIERRLALAVARTRVNKTDVRYWRAVEGAFSLLDSPDVVRLWHDD